MFVEHSPFTMKLLEAFHEQIELELKTLARDREPAGLYEPVTYVLSLGGKRIRPALCMLGCNLYDELKVPESLHPALGLEVFHNFTLLHDDIMDGSEMRRNQPTVHKKWNDNTAILSGDAMMILAYQLISRSPIKVLVPVLELFSQTGLEVCEGQQYDMLFESRNDITEADYIEMIRLKTAVLLGASLKTGAIIGGASPEAAMHLYQFGIEAGISFQLQDDWLDVFGDAATFGKNIGGDIVTNKKTFLLIHALNNLSPAGKKELQLWLSKKEFDREEKVAAVRNLYEDANVSTNAKKRMDAYYQNSLLHLQKAGGSTDVQQELTSFARQLMERSR